MTGDDWRRLGVLLGVLALGTLACWAFWAAKGFLSLPMEAGGLVFGPFVGLPLLTIGMTLLVAAARFAVRWWP